MKSLKTGLPRFIHEGNKYAVGSFLAVLACLLYLPSNHFHLFEPQLLPLTKLDQLIPFLPYTVWIYVSEYPFFVVIYLLCRNMLNLNKYFYSFLFLQTTSVLIFILWPTTYPRELFPLPSDLDVLTQALFSSLRETDSPANCCPSLHVSSVYLCSFLFLNEQKKKFPFFFAWGTAIALSTLTTKQHYWVDILAGLVMAILTYHLFYKKITYSEKNIKK